MYNGRACADTAHTNYYPHLTPGQTPSQHQQNYINYHMATVSCWFEIVITCYSYCDNMTLYMFCYTLSTWRSSAKWEVITRYFKVPLLTERLLAAGNTCCCGYWSGFITTLDSLEQHLYTAHSQKEPIVCHEDTTKATLVTTGRGLEWDVWLN